MADQRQGDGGGQALGHDLADILVVEEGVAEIEAGDDARYPAEILHDDGVVEAMGLAVELSLRFGHGRRRAALVDEHGADGVAIVAGRRLDDGEGHDAEQEEQRDRAQDAHGQKSKHGGLLTYPALAPGSQSSPF